MIVGLAAALAVAMLATGFSLKFLSALSAGGTAAVYLAAAFYNSRRGAKRDPLVIFSLGSTGQVLGHVAVLLTVRNTLAKSSLQSTLGWLGRSGGGLLPLYAHVHGRRGGVWKLLDEFITDT